MDQYLGIKMWDSGAMEEEIFETFLELCQWFALSPKAGCDAYLNGEPIDHGELCEAIETCR